MAETLKNLRNLVEAVCTSAFMEAELDPRFAEIRNSDRPDLADFQCNGLLALSKILGEDTLLLFERFSSTSAAKGSLNLFRITYKAPGFINFSLADEVLLTRFSQLSEDTRFGLPEIKCEEFIMLDYGGPNIAKEMHVGHIRSSVIGQALYNLFKMLGYNVISDVHLGDWGLQMGLLISEITDTMASQVNLNGQEKIDVSSLDLQEVYPRANSRAKNDPEFLERARNTTAELQKKRGDYYELWQALQAQSIDKLRVDFARLGVNFDLWYGESRYQERLDELVAELLASKVAEKSDGAIVIRFPEEMKMPPLILRNSNGAYGYGATDLATIEERVEDIAVDRVIYIVDSRQSLHFKQVFEASKISGISKNCHLEHAKFGTINGSDGKPFKTRDGGTMRLTDLLNIMFEEALSKLEQNEQSGSADSKIIGEEIALGGLVFGELIHDREKDYIFDPAQFINFEGKTGPYLQYTSVRMTALLSRAREAGVTPSKEISSLAKSGREMILCLDEFSEIVMRTVQLRKPSILAAHAFELASKLNGFYHDNRIFEDGEAVPDANDKLGLISTAHRQLLMCLNVLGIPIPSRM